MTASHIPSPSAVPIRFRIAKEVHALDVYRRQRREARDTVTYHQLTRQIERTHERIRLLADQCTAEAAAIRGHREVTVTGPVKATDPATGDTYRRFFVAITDKTTGRPVATTYKVRGEQQAFTIALRISKDRGLDIADRTALNAPTR